MTLGMLIKELQKHEFNLGKLQNTGVSIEGPADDPATLDILEVRMIDNRVVIIAEG